MVVIRKVVIMGQMMVMMMIVEGVEIVVIEVVEKMVVMPRMSMIIKKMALSISRFYQKFLPVGGSRVKPANLPVSRLSMFALC